MNAIAEYTLVDFQVPLPNKAKARDTKRKKERMDEDIITYCGSPFLVTDLMSP